MIVTVLQDKLAKALNIVSKAVEARPTLPVLSNILLEAEGSQLKLAATNLQLSITMWIGARVDQPGAITLPAKTFSDLINNLSQGQVSMNLDAATHTVRVSAGATKSNIRGIDADEFPPIQHGDEPDFFMDGKTLREMIRQTTFAAAKEDNRPILTGVYFDLNGDQITMAAADGYRLAVRKARMIQPVRQKTNIVVPARALNEVARALEDTQEVGVTLPGKRDIVTFHMPDLQISSQLLEGRFPDFSAIIPKTYVTSTTMYVDDLLKACKRAEIFARDNANSGRLYVKPASTPGDIGEVLVVGRSSERGDNEGMLDAAIEGEPLDISFNISYLIEVLNVMSDERVIFQSNGAENPGVIKPENRDDFIHVIMPMSR